MNSDGGTDAYEAHTLSEMLYAGDAARTALHSAYCSAGVAARSQPRHRSILLTLVGITTRVFASLYSRSAASAFQRSVLQAVEKYCMIRSLFGYIATQL